jgi:phosphatidylglycerophosphate synthase
VPGLANALTALRLAGAPLLGWAVVSGASAVAFLVFWLAVATDFLDGRVARRTGAASPAGGLFDHATDATFVTIGLAACAAQGLATPWLPALVAAAFLQYTVDSRVFRGRPLRASRLGRWNGIAYYVALGVPVVRDGLAIGWPPDTLVRLLAWALVATSVVSIADRSLAAWRARGLAGAS